MKQENPISLLHLVINSDIIVQAVLLCLIIASIWSWTIIFNKLNKLRKAQKYSSSFENMATQCQTIEEISNQAKAKNIPLNPLSIAFAEGFSEWNHSTSNKSHAQIVSHFDNIRQRVLTTMEISSTKSLAKFEENLSILAIIGSIAPFIGLFGTVWGIMDSFFGIANSNNVSLPVVAPGIAESLFATAIGLFSAIPASLFYNYFSTKIAELGDSIQNFSSLIAVKLSRELEK